MRARPGIKEVREDRSAGVRPAEVAGLRREGAIVEIRVVASNDPTADCARFRARIGSSSRPSNRAARCCTLQRYAHSGCSRPRWLPVRRRHPGNDVQGGKLAMLAANQGRWESLQRYQPVRGTLQRRHVRGCEHIAERKVLCHKGPSAVRQSVVQRKACPLPSRVVARLKCGSRPRAAGQCWRPKAACQPRFRPDA